MVPPGVIHLDNVVYLPVWVPVLFELIIPCILVHASVIFKCLEIFKNLALLKNCVQWEGQSKCLACHMPGNRTLKTQLYIPSI